MTKIKILPDSVINQIAAGEVVERPSAVVRELVDNAVDADASEITIELVDGGHTLIRVTDDGIGMSKEDALISIERHATSKLSQITDLEQLHTLGFRGEALASIAAVSRMRLRTKERHTTLGTEIEISGGTVIKVEELAAPFGTTLEIRNIFFNTPARKKFLKSSRSEEMRVKEWVRHTAIVHPSIHYRVLFDGKEVCSIPRVDSVLDRGGQFFKGSTVRFDKTYDDMEFEGIVGHPSLAQGDSGSFLIYVNNRLITDRAILRAVRDGFSPTLKEREFPVGFIRISIPADQVDVNVNPQKSEVRFASPQKIFLGVRKAVESSVREFKLPMEGSFIPAFTSRPGVSSQSTEQMHTQQMNAQQMNPEQRYIPLSVQTSVRESSMHYAQFGNAALQTVTELTVEPNQQKNFSYSQLRYLGQLFECYLLGEYQGEFYIVDMHAAHERINFNCVQECLRRQTDISQVLLVPITVHLSERGVHNILAHGLGEYGFDVEEFGNDGIVVRAVPSVLSGGDVEGLIKELAGIPEDQFSSTPVHSKIDSLAARIACHSSIRSGRILHREEAYALFEAMDKAEMSAACPHGRPCIVKFSEKQIEQWFGRDR